MNKLLVKTLLAGCASQNHFECLIAFFCTYDKLLDTSVAADIVDSFKNGTIKRGAGNEHCRLW